MNEKIAKGTYMYQMQVNGNQIAWAYPVAKFERKLARKNNRKVKRKKSQSLKNQKY